MVPTEKGLESTTEGQYKGLEIQIAHKNYNDK